MRAGALAVRTPFGADQAQERDVQDRVSEEEIVLQLERGEAWAGVAHERLLALVGR